MPTYIDKRIDGLLIAANDDNGLTCDLTDEKLADFVELALMSDENPGLKNDVLDIFLKHLGTQIEFLLQGIPGLVLGNKILNR